MGRGSKPGNGEILSARGLPHMGQQIDGYRPWRDIYFKQCDATGIKSPKRVDRVVTGIDATAVVFCSAYDNRVRAIILVSVPYTGLRLRCSADVRVGICPGLLIKGVITAFGIRRRLCRTAKNEHPADSDQSSFNYLYFHSRLPSKII